MAGKLPSARRLTKSKKMKYLICLPFLIFLFGSCQNNDSNQSEDASSDGNNDAKKITEFELRVSKTDVSDFLNENEKISEILEWDNHNGKQNVLIFSERIFENSSDEPVIIDSTDLGDGRKVPVYGTFSMVKNKTIYVRYVVESRIAMVDSVSEISCIGDIFLQYFTSEVHVTDIDADDSPEIWVPFISDCMSAVAPVDTRMIVYNKNSKCTILGTILYADSNSKSLEVPQFPDCISNNELMMEYATKVWTKLSEIDIFK